MCKALVTKASVFIPGLSPYLLALYKTMKAQGTHEECIEQMQRLFSTKLYGQDKIPLDGERLIRMDDWELDPDTQNQVGKLLEQMNADNFKTIGDFEGFQNTFLNLNGFALDDVDYTKEVDVERLQKLRP